MRVFGLVVALLVALTLCLYPLALVDDLYPFLLLPCAAAAAFLLSLLTGEWVLVGPGAGVLLFAYVMALSDSGTSLDPFAIAFAAGVLLLLDVFDLVPLLGRNPRPPRQVLVAHIRHLMLVVGLGTAVALALVAAAGLIGGGPALLAAPAAFAGLAAVVIAVAQARRSIERS